MPHFEPLAYSYYEATQPQLPPHNSLPELVHMENPARDILLPLDALTHATVQAETHIDQAIQQMHGIGSHFLLVVNDDHQLIGLVTSACLLGKKPIQILHERRINREQLHVQHLMQPSTSLICLNENELEHARVGHIIASLRDAQQKQALVFHQNEGEAPTIIGLFDQSHIEHQLHHRIE
jgi:CBS-domain-containing membrane protein